MTQETRKLRINGRPVPTVCNQMVFSFDFSDLDLGVPLPTPPQFPKKMKRPKCECGAKKCGYKDYMRGHADWCEVHMDKTPVTTENPFYEKE